MRLASDWRKIIKHSYSVKVLAFAAVLSGMEFVMPYFADAFADHPRIFAGIMFLVVAAAFFARIVAQHEFED